MEVKGEERKEVNGRLVKKRTITCIQIILKSNRDIITIKKKISLKKEQSKKEETEG